MIDAATFAANYNAFWSEHTSTLTHFIKRLNLENVERWNKPIDKPTRKIRSAFIAEWAFARFAEEFSDRKSSEDVEEQLLLETLNRMRTLVEDPTTLEVPVSNIEKQQANEIKHNLCGFFRAKNEAIKIWPSFHGCGFIDESEGDVIQGTTLYEVKTVDRKFRGLDIRQLVTYCGLNHFSRQYSIKNIGVFNPRQGTFFKISVDKVCDDISGKTFQELFDIFLHVISSGEISK